MIIYERTGIIYVIFPEWKDLRWSDETIVS